MSFIAEEPLHARLSPSNKRWPVCAGSIREEAQYEDIPGEAAIDGTGSHLLLELCMENNVVAAHYDGQIIGINHPDQPNGWMIHQDRIERVQMALDYVTRRVGELKEQFPDAEIIVESESRSNPGEAFCRTDWWGTCDITITVVQGGACLFLEAADYKDGRGWVDVKENTQLISYLFGKMLPYIKCGDFHPTKPDILGSKVGDCRQTIIQPKTSTPIRYDDDTTPDGVVTAAKKLNEAACRTDDPDAPLTPSKDCQWCKANPKRGGHCTATTDQSIATLENLKPGDIEQIPDEGGLFEHIGKAITDPTSLTAKQLVELADAKPGLDAAFDKVLTEIERRVTADASSVPGYAMQPGSSKQVWSQDEKAIVKMLKGRRLKQIDIYPPKLISPAAALKLKALKPEQKARIEKDYISKVAGKNRLVRVAYTKPTAEMMFADVSQCVTVDTPDKLGLPAEETQPVSFME